MSFIPIRPFPSVKFIGGVCTCTHCLSPRLCWWLYLPRAPSKTCFLVCNGTRSVFPPSTYAAQCDKTPRSAGLDTGDLVLFDRPCLKMGGVFGAAVCAAAKVVGGSPFDHVGVVVRKPPVRASRIYRSGGLNFCTGSVLCVAHSLVTYVCVCLCVWCCFDTLLR